MPVNAVAPLAAAMDKTSLQQEKFRFVEGESLVLIPGSQLLQKLLSLAHRRGCAKICARSMDVHKYLCMFNKS